MKVLESQRASVDLSCNAEVPNFRKLLSSLGLKGYRKEWVFSQPGRGAAW